MASASIGGVPTITQHSYPLAGGVTRGDLYVCPTGTVSYVWFDAINADTAQVTELGIFLIDPKTGLATVFKNLLAASTLYTGYVRLQLDFKDIQDRIEGFVAYNPTTNAAMRATTVPNVMIPLFPGEKIAYSITTFSGSAGLQIQTIEVTAGS